jgi:predicted molibdopterin-dependent oxidoreductase YjgC
MPISRESHAPSHTSFSGHTGVVEAAGAAGVTDEDPADSVVVVAAGPFDEVHPAAANAIQRNTRRIHQIPEIFIHPFFRKRG